VAPKSARALADGMAQQIEKLKTESAQTLPASLFSWEQTFREVNEIYRSV
jgi:hypothetical protein